MRRRKKNTLLPKMIGIAVLVNAVLLPILAQLGVFKGVRGNHLQEVKLVKLPPPEKKPATRHKAPPKKKIAKARPKVGNKVAARPAVSRPNPSQPKVVASASSSGSGNGPVIDNSGTAPVGQLPPAPAAPTPPAPQPAPPPAPAPQPAPPVPVPVAAPPPPHVPVVVAAEPLDQPRPQIPDGLSYDDIHGNFQALFAIGADGSATVKMLSSTGDPTLDQLALDAARRWTFRPATVDGKPTDSFRRLTIEFYPT